VLYEMLAGIGLFHGPSTVRTIMRVRTMEVPPIATHRSDVPESLQAILECALQRDPDRRFPSAGDMGYQLEFYLYKDGFGPTNDKLCEYMRTILPELFALPGAGGGEKLAPTTRFDLPVARPDLRAEAGARPAGLRGGETLAPTTRLGPPPEGLPGAGAPDEDDGDGTAFL